MHEEVKFIFKTLIKVPVIIMIAYGVLNLFAFFFIYFKMLGLSYVVMETAVENNYLPQRELQQLYAYVNSMNDGQPGGIPWVKDADIILGYQGMTPGTASYTKATSDSSDGDAATSDVILCTGNYTAVYGDADARTKKQYGSACTVGVQCNFKLVWPLSYSEQVSSAYDYQDTNEGVAGYYQANGTNTGYNFNGWQSASQLDAKREAKEDHANMRMVYTVPGLKYYPDMLLTH